MFRTPLILALALAPVVVPFAACSGEDGGSDSLDAGTGVPDARPDRSEGDSVVGDVTPDRAPTYNTDGWIGIPFDPDVDCGFYAAPTPEKMPPPIQWDDCDPTMNVAGWACRKIAFTWAPPDQGLFSNHLMAPALGGWVDEVGHAWLVVNRFSSASAYYLVAEADGPVHTALVRPSGSCYVNGASLTGRRVIFDTSRQDKSGTPIYRWGAIGGDVDKVPLVLESYGDGIGRGYAAGPNAYFTLPEYALKTWASPSVVVAPVPTPPSSGQIGRVSFVGDTMFFPFGNLSYHRISVFSSGSGTRDFVSYGNDFTKGASDFGTDGKDMVWTEAFGRASPADLTWPTVDIMAAPFTADPSAIQKRRLRSESSGVLGGAPFVVGCGYAAHDLAGADGGTRLVRLSDGRSWSFTKAVVDGGPNWLLGGALAITCDELFIRFHRGQQDNVARIRLDSLGPGDPPD